MPRAAGFRIIERNRLLEYLGKHRIFQIMFSMALEINLPAHCHLLSMAAAVAHNAVT